LDYAKIGTLDLSYPSSLLCRTIFKDSIMPGLAEAFDIFPGDQPDKYKSWRDRVECYLGLKLGMLQDHMEECTLVITSTDEGIQLAFYPSTHPKPILNLRVDTGKYFTFTLDHNNPQ
jgi:hypothetical protein